MNKNKGKIKKIAITYKGAFKVRDFKDGTEPNITQLLSEIEETLKNHKSILYDYFKDSEIDFYFSTYDLNEKINELYKKNLNLKYYDYLPNNVLRSTYKNDRVSWGFQFAHYKNIISAIKEQNTSYDLFIFARPDLIFLKDDFNSFNIDFSKFNIVLEHLSGNCDDNFFVFPEEFLNSFEESINELQQKGGITHELNKELHKRNVPINYMSEINENDIFWLRNGYEYMPRYDWPWENGEERAKEMIRRVRNK